MGESSSGGQQREAVGTEVMWMLRAWLFLKCFESLRLLDGTHDVIFRYIPNADELMQWNSQQGERSHVHVHQEVQVRDLWPYNI